jgi:hypothetical protein
VLVDMEKNIKLRMFFFSLVILSIVQQAVSDIHQPLSKVAIHNTVFALNQGASIKANPNLLGLKVINYLSFFHFIDE